MSGMEYAKVSFLGDIMCEGPFLRAARVKGGYDFDRAFSETERFFSGSDYIIGNLETVFAGKELKYTHDLYSFNTPDPFAGALKRCGIDLVSTANNHCLDRGMAGVRRTLDVLDANGIRHTGTYRSKAEAEVPCVIDVKGIRIGLLAYTYGTNPNINRVLLQGDERYCVDLLQPQEYRPDTSLAARLKGSVSVDTKTKIKKLLGRPYKNHIIDTLPNSLDERIRHKADAVREQSDYSICLLHCGGQFNAEPGDYSRYMMGFFAEAGMDSIIGNHPHNVQEAERMPRGIATYCLGNVSLSPSSIYVPMENHPDYSVMLHLYFGVETKKVERITASVLIIREDGRGYLKVYPAHEAIEKCGKSERDDILKNTETVLRVFMKNKSFTAEMQEEWEVVL